MATPNAETPSGAPWSSPSTASWRSEFSHYLPRLHRAFYQSDSVVLWTMPMSQRAAGWLGDEIHAVFREVMLHAAARERLVCPAYCLMPDHIHHVWMGGTPESDQRRAIRFLRAHLTPRLQDAKFQHQAHDHVLRSERERAIGAMQACCEYVYLNPLRAGLVPRVDAWKYTGAVVPGYPQVDVFAPGYWEWFWKRHALWRDPRCDAVIRPRRQME